MSIKYYERGSEWRQWDLHIHSPASFQWSGSRFTTDPNDPMNTSLLDQMVKALNAAEPAVYALMDYWTFDGWFALKRRQADQSAPKLCKTVFPGIELRLVSPSIARLNAHVLFSDQIPDQDLKDFLSRLTIEIVSKPLSRASLIELARIVGKDKLSCHGFKKAEVDTNDDIALQAGSTIAEINCDSYKRAIQEVPGGNAIGFMPYDTSDGLKEVKWQEHYAYFIGLFSISPIFESRNFELRDAFLNIRTPKNSKYIDNFTHGLLNIPRLVVSGSDAHQMVGKAGDNNKRGYGDFPSGKVTWIKADPTFEGLLQAIKEPAKRSFIGQVPPKLEALRQYPMQFIDSVSVSSEAGARFSGMWLDGCKVSLNKDLVAIIGNKGSGKSALADVLALLGNSRQHMHFSFLKRDRFRGKSGEPAKYFTATLNWLAGSSMTRNLNDNPLEENTEQVKYIPQGHFEELCNDHVSGKSNAFEQELRSVIFAHTSDQVRLGAASFDELIAQQESSYRDQLADVRKRLGRINDDISFIEGQLQPAVKKSIEELIAQKNQEINEHIRLKPIDAPRPSAELTEEEQATAKALDNLGLKLKELDMASSGHSQAMINIAKKLTAAREVREKIRVLQRAFTEFVNGSEVDRKLLEIDLEKIAVLTINVEALDAIEKELSGESAQGVAAQDNRDKSRVGLVLEQERLQASLNAPQQRYQEYLTALSEWNTRHQNLVGTSAEAETLEGLKARLITITEHPKKLALFREERLKLVEEIYFILEAQRSSREALFYPIQELIRKNELIREEYKLQFLAALGNSVDLLAANLFTLIKQNTGEFRGEDESLGVVKRLADQFDFNTKDGVKAFVSDLLLKIENAISGSNIGITAILRKDKSPQDVYNLLFGLSFLEPRYTLKFQETPIEQLSPGQRGALLLIFYLLVDKGRSPIILDQPEENLDNETVVSLLVPVLTEAKRTRQIIMVTHNPNLAVVCDAEQVIYASFDRKNGHKIYYCSGSIESPTTNKHVVDVLEGTMPAFTNRREKYQKVPN